MNSEIKYFIENISKFSRSNCSPNSLYNTQVEKGQRAKTLVISCADSLVDPMILMGARVGQVFSHRNISGLVYPYDSKNNSPIATAAVLEYGVNNLEVNDIIILGHGCCGGISALIKGGQNFQQTEHISDWLKILEPIAKNIIKNNKNLSFEQQRSLCEKEATLVSLANLKTFPFIKQRLENKQLNIHAWHFDRGVLNIYQNNNWEEIQDLNDK